MSEVKQRKKGISSSKTNEGSQKGEKHSNCGKLASPRTSNNWSSFWMDSRTSLSIISLAVCLVLSWFLFQQSNQFADMEKKYNFLQKEAEKFLDVENKVNLISGKCEKTWNLMEELEDLKIISHIKHLQEDIYTMKMWSSSIIKKQEELQKNSTTLFHAVSSVEQNAASIAKNITLMIVTVKTDIRRISGLVSDMTTLTDSLQTLEDKVEKGEEKTVKNIGNLLTSSIDRSTELQSLAFSNARKIEQIQTALSELRSDFNKHSDRLLNLEGDRAKVLKTVTFANDLKPKMYKLKKDFAILEPLISDLTLRIGRLVEDILRREKEIALLNEKLANLTRVQTEIKDMKDEITKISDMN
ncbi:PREDICTED: inhibitor of nuclear factor kappa-B kinase-interacting protein isoform X2 [Pterocles gutturalis]|uniref:Inhibitor of nuclear factor kappa-B kinase-interacting protein n=1 Tax=Pterocles gutturalis TaxID=240206 RepID=A0AAW3DSR4_9AVES|nr:PREDICTED: inhibitor of nuclear factor kappa-B kinase-interacting protein isoform X2 [Pterocles gutturalis]KFV02716.1 Inhibitor of nuclear factor kappa-B kinase-interacting protein [Pterocles gutturalis]